jgi:succinate dehydrogenase / fumarate reductase, cytochrome b subunit
MANLFSSSIGKKVIMSLTGFFLITFLCVHLAVNLALLGGQEAYNTAANFMGTNPMMKIMEPVLALGFILHIIYAMILTAKNMGARPVKYNRQTLGNSSTWASRNMVALGIFVLAFLVIHLVDFWAPIKITHTVGEYIAPDGTVMEDVYSLVVNKFKIWWIDVIYIIGFVALGFHLTHGFWSLFQSIGLNNNIWIKRFKAIAMVYSVVIVVGFTIIPLYFLIA